MSHVVPMPVDDDLWPAGYNAEGERVPDPWGDFGVLVLQGLDSEPLFKMLDKRDKTDSQISIIVPIYPRLDFYARVVIEEEINEDVWGISLLLGLETATNRGKIDIGVLSRGEGRLSIHYTILAILDAQIDTPGVRRCRCGKIVDPPTSFKGVPIAEQQATMWAFYSYGCCVTCLQKTVEFLMKSSNLPQL